MKSACRMLCWTGTIGGKLHVSTLNFSFIIVSSGMHLHVMIMDDGHRAIFYLYLQIDLQKNVHETCTRLC